MFALSKTNDVMARMVEDTLQKGNTKVTIQTISLRYLASVIKGVGLSWYDVCDLVHFTTPVAPQVSKQILHDSSMLDEETLLTFAQDFIRNDRLLRQLKRMPRKKAEKVLAIDGLHGTINTNGPVMDIKRYFENLRFDMDGSGSMFDEPEQNRWKRHHVFAVRELYDQLQTMLPDQDRYAGIVYQILRTAIKQVGGPDLPPLEDESDTPLDLEPLVEFYIRCTNKDNIVQLIEHLRVKRDKSEEETDETVKGTKRDESQAMETGDEGKKTGDEGKKLKRDRKQDQNEHNCKKTKKSGVLQALENAKTAA